MNTSAQCESDFTPNLGASLIQLHILMVASSRKCLYLVTKLLRLLCSHADCLFR